MWLVGAVYFNHACDDGYSLAEARETFHGEAEKHFGGISKGTLELIYAP